MQIRRKAGTLGRSARAVPGVDSEDARMVTPYLCAGVANANLDRFDEAIRWLEYVEKMAACNPEYSAATRVLKLIASRTFQVVRRSKLPPQSLSVVEITISLQLTSSPKGSRTSGHE